MSTTESNDRTPPDPTNNPKHVAVIVLGDVGRSPRMQYHALSLLQHDHMVSLVGYEGEELIPELQSYADSTISIVNGDGVNVRVVERLNVVRFEPYAPPKKMIKPFYLFLRLVGILYGLIHALWVQLPQQQLNSMKKRSKDRSSHDDESFIEVDCLLLQNPPSIPLLFLSYLYSISKSSRLGRRRRRPGIVVDWHNLGYTMFDLHPNHPIRLFAYAYEKFMAGFMDGHLCVTAAMQRWLLSNFHIGIGGGDGGNGRIVEVLRDRPPHFFSPTTLEQKHELMSRLEGEDEGLRSLSNKLKEIREKSQHDNDGNKMDTTIIDEETLLTRRVVDEDGTNRIVPRPDRPALLISSTSWTPDEDFSILLEALVELDHHQQQTKLSSTITTTTPPSNNLPHVLVVVTGKGPQKKYYQDKISSLSLSHVTILTMWLTASDYPLLLGCADLGISLHTSTSGLDLPMKILDMFGCEVPVCAVRFECLEELVEDGVNGSVFGTCGELKDQLIRLLGGRTGGDDGDGGSELGRMRGHIRGMTRWKENWDEKALDVIMDACPDRSGSEVRVDEKAKME